jgi:excisionase family DNA binding protein
MSDLITTDEAAEIIGISRQSVVKAINAGKIEAFRVGHGYNVSRGSVIEYAKSDSRQRRQAAKGK